MFSVIVCSVDSAKAAELRENIAQTIGVPFEVRVFDNREARQGICAVYNACAREARYELLCFVHEDVRFRTAGWGALLAERLRAPRCGVVGFAGGTMKLRSITGWCLDRRDARTHYDQPDASGRWVRHRDNPAAERFSRVVCLDGFCLMTRREVWRQAPFDETTLPGFHGYDLDFTLAAARRYENQVCHTVDVQHFSAGKYTSAWRAGLEAFHAKWCDRLPVFAGAEVGSRALAALECRAEALWWRKLLRQRLCSRCESVRAVSGFVRRHPFSIDAWVLVYKWLRYDYLFKR